MTLEELLADDALLAKLQERDEKDQLLELARRRRRKYEEQQAAIVSLMGPPQHPFEDTK